MTAELVFVIKRKPVGTNKYANIDVTAQLASKGLLFGF